MFKGHMSLLHVGRKKIFTNQFIRNLCPFVRWGAFVDCFFSIKLSKKPIIILILSDLIAFLVISLILLTKVAKN
jgi:uncharacterized membrane protein